MSVITDNLFRSGSPQRTAALAFTVTLIVSTYASGQPAQPALPADPAAPPTEPMPAPPVDTPPPPVPPEPPVQTDATKDEAKDAKKDDKADAKKDDKADSKKDDKKKVALELKPGGYVHVDGRRFLNETKAHELTIRRLSFKLDGTASKYFKFRTLIDFAPASSSCRTRGSRRCCVPSYRFAPARTSHSSASSACRVRRS